jgi:hypothetical protein
MPSSNNFEPICYLNRYPDLKDAYMYLSANGHWQYGHPSNRQVKKISDNLFWHWQNFGMAEGRVEGCDLPGTNYSANFNASAYKARYYDVRVGWDLVTGKYGGYDVNPENHYQTIGIYQGRHPGFEILTSKSPIGMTSPGTTTTIVDNPATNQAPGDNTVLPAINPDTGNAINPKTGNEINPKTGNDINPITGNDINPKTGLDVDPVTGKDIPAGTGTGSMSDTWLIVGGIAVILLLTKKKKKR